MYDDNFSPSDGGSLAHIYLRFDKSYDVYTRTVKDFLTLLSDIGGLQKALFAIGLIFVSFFAQKMFMANIIRRVYQVRKYDEERDHVSSSLRNSVEIDENFWDSSENQNQHDNE